MRAPRPVAVLVAVVAVVGAGLTTLTLVRPAEVATEEPAQGVLQVSSATLVCPDPSLLAEGGSTELTFTAPRLDDVGSVAGDTAGVGGLDPSTNPLVSVDERGPVGVLASDELEEAAAVVRALGSLAPGLAAGQLSESAEGDGRGIAAVRCTEAGTSAWFVGLGTEIGHRPRLSLVNPESTPAELDVRVFGPDGEVEAAGGSDLLIAGRDGLTLELDALAPDLEQLVVQVAVRSGRVASAVRDVRVDGLTSLGVDWVPVAAEPAERVVVPGISGGDGPRLLQLLAPGDLDALVEVRLLTARGPIVPLAIDGIELTAGVVREVALDPVTAGEVLAVELVADQPIVAGARVVLESGDGAQEMAYTAGALPLQDVAVATDVRIGSGFASILLLSAEPGATEPADVVISYVSPATGEELVSERVSVPPGSTLTVALDDADLPDRFAVTVTPIMTPSGTPIMTPGGTPIGAPGGAPVHAVLQLAQKVDGEVFISLVPLRSTRFEVDVPRVRHDLSAGLRLPS